MKHNKSQDTQNVEVVEVEEGAYIAERGGEAPKQPNGKFLPVSILIAAAVIGGVIVFAATRGGSLNGSNGAAQLPPSGAPAAPTPASVPPISGRDVVLGNANAPVTLIEYGDYQCPFCGRFFSQVEPSLRTDYINTGKVKMVFRNFQFLGQESVAAGEAAECAQEQNKFWAYHDALYAAKVGDAANGENDGFFNRAEFIKLAEQVKLDANAFTSCIDGNKYVKQIEQDKASASALGVNSTPTTFINGQQVVGAQPYSAFKAVIDAALQKK